MITQLKKAEQNKVDTLINLLEKESAIGDKLRGMALRMHESETNFRAYEKLEKKQEKIFFQFSEKYKKLPHHCAPAIEAYCYNWEDFQEN